MNAPSNPLDNLLDCFVSDGEGVAFIERSLCAHRLQLSDDAQSLILDSASRTTTAKSSSRATLSKGPPFTLLGSSNKPGSLTSTREGEDVVDKYDGIVRSKVKTYLAAANKLQQLAAKTKGTVNPIPPSPSSWTSATASNWCRFLTVEERTQAVDLDVADHLSHTVDEALLTMTLTQSTFHASPVITVCSFVYVVSRAITRTTLLQLSRADIIKMFTDDDDEAPTDLVSALLASSKIAALDFFVTVDVNHVWSVQWSDITSALVEYSNTRHFRQGEGLVCGGSTVNQPLDLQSWKRQRIGQYDRYEPRPFPSERHYRTFNGAIHVVTGSPFLLFEGRGDTMAMIHRDDLNIVKHVIPRHRADPNKLLCATVLSTAMIDASTSAVLVAEVDMHIYLYDFGPKKRHRLQMLCRLKCSYAITASCYLARHVQFLVGDRVGNIRVVDVARVLLDASRDADTSAAVVEDHPLLESSVEEYQCAVLLAHTDAVTAMAVSAQSLLISVGLDGVVVVHNNMTWFRIRSFPAHDRGVSSVVADVEGEVFCTRGFDGSVLLWQTAHGVNHISLEDTTVPHTHRIGWLFLDCSVQQLISLDVSGLCKVWDMYRGDLIQTFFAVSQSPPYLDMPLAVGSGIDKEGTILREIPDDVAPVQFAAFAVQSHTLFVRGYRNEYCAQLIEARKTQKAHMSPIRSAILLSASKMVVTMCSKMLRCWSLTNALSLAFEVPANKRFQPGDIPDPLPHHQKGQQSVGGGGDATAHTMITRSDLLHRALNALAGDEDCMMPLSSTGQEGSSSAVEGVMLGRNVLEYTAACSDSTGEFVFLALSNGTLRCHKTSSGACTKIFVATKVQDAASSSGRSLDVAACCYLTSERRLVAVYTDGAIRYFNNQGTQRTPICCQLPADGIPAGKASTFMKNVTRRVSRMSSVVNAMNSLATDREQNPHRYDSPFVSPLAAPGLGDPEVTPSPSRGGNGSAGTTDDGRITGYILCVVSEGLRLCAAATANGIVQILELGNLGPVTKVLHEHVLEADILSMCFMGDMPCLVVGDAVGRVSFFLVRGSPSLITVQDLWMECTSLEKRRRASRMFSTVGGRTPNSASLNSNARRKSVAPPSTPQAGSIERDRHKAIWRITVSGKPLSLSFDQSSSLLIVGGANGQTEVVSTFNLITALSLRSISSATSIVDVIAQNRQYSRDDGTRDMLIKIALPQLLPNDQEGLLSTSCTLLSPTALSFVDGADALGEASMEDLHVLWIIVKLWQFAQTHASDAWSVEEKSRASWIEVRKMRSSCETVGAILSVDQGLTCLPPLTASLWGVQRTARGSAFGIDATMPFARRLRSTVAKSGSAPRSSNKVPLTDDDTSAVTCVVVIGGGYCVVGSQDGNACLAAIGCDGCISQLSPSASVLSSLTDVIQEWKRVFAVRQHVRKNEIVAQSRVAEHDTIQREGSWFVSDAEAQSDDVFLHGTSIDAIASAGVSASQFASSLESHVQDMVASLQEVTSPAQEHMIRRIFESSFTRQAQAAKALLVELRAKSKDFNNDSLLDSTRAFAKSPQAFLTPFPPPSFPVSNPDRRNTVLKVTRASPRVSGDGSVLQTAIDFRDSIDIVGFNLTEPSLYEEFDIDDDASDGVKAFVGRTTKQPPRVPFEREKNRPSGKSPTTNHTLISLIKKTNSTKQLGNTTLSRHRTITSGVPVSFPLSASRPSTATRPSQQPNLGDEIGFGLVLTTTCT